MIWWYLSLPGEMSRPGSTLIQPEPEQLYVPLGPPVITSSLSLSSSLFLSSTLSPWSLSLSSSYTVITRNVHKHSSETTPTCFMTFESLCGSMASTGQMQQRRKIEIQKTLEISPELSFAFLHLQNFCKTLQNPFWDAGLMQPQNKGLDFLQDFHSAFDQLWC